MGDFYTFVTMVTADYYLSHVWAAAETEKLVSKHAGKAITIIADIEKSRAADIPLLTDHELVEWIKQDPELQFAERITRDHGKRRRELIDHLSVIRAATASIGEKPPIAQLTAAWSAAKRNTSDQRGMIDSALRQQQMRSEYVLVPTLPGEKTIGFVVQLRDIRSVDRHSMHLHPVDATVSGSNTAHARVARLSDGIRYAIIQRFATLFSRIGMSEHFEGHLEQYLFPRLRPPAGRRVALM